MELDPDSLELQRNASSARRRLKLSALALMACVVMLFELVAEAQASYHMEYLMEPVSGKLILCETGQQSE